MTDVRGHGVTLTRLVVVLVAIGMVGPTGVSAQASSELAADGVAVVPFDNISGGAEDAWLGAGIAETVTAGLTGSRAGLRSVTRVADAAAGMGLGVRWIVSGSYQRLGDQLRVTARVVDTSTGMVVGTVTVDGASPGLFTLQDRVVDALVPMLAGLVPGGRGPDEARAPTERPAGEPERVARTRGIPTQS